jgi:hypothetical protein
MGRTASRRTQSPTVLRTHPSKPSGDRRSAMRVSATSTATIPDLPSRLSTRDSVRPTARLRTDHQTPPWDLVRPAPRYAQAEADTGPALSGSRTRSVAGAIGDHDPQRHAQAKADTSPALPGSRTRSVAGAFGDHDPPRPSGYSSHRGSSTRGPRTFHCSFNSSEWKSYTDARDDPTTPIQFSSSRALQGVDVDVRTVPFASMLSGAAASVGMAYRGWKVDYTGVWLPTPREQESLLCVNCGRLGHSTHFCRDEYITGGGANYYNQGKPLVYRMLRLRKVRALAGHPGRMA